MRGSSVSSPSGSTLRSQLLPLGKHGSAFSCNASNVTWLCIGLSYFDENMIKLYIRSCFSTTSAEASQAVEVQVFFQTFLPLS